MLANTRDYSILPGYNLELPYPQILCFFVDIYICMKTYILQASSFHFIFHLSLHVLHYSLILARATETLQNWVEKCSLYWTLYRRLRTLHGCPMGSPLPGIRAQVLHLPINLTFAFHFPLVIPSSEGSAWKQNPKHQEVTRKNDLSPEFQAAGCSGPVCTYSFAAALGISRSPSLLGFPPQSSHGIPKAGPRD